MLLEYCKNCGRSYGVYDGWNGTDSNCHRRPYDNMFDCPHCKKNRMCTRKKKVWEDEDGKIKKIADYNMQEDIVSVTVKKGDNFFDIEAKTKKERDRMAKRIKDYSLFDVYELQLSDKDRKRLDKLSGEGYNPISVTKQYLLKLAGKEYINSGLTLYDYKNHKGKDILVTWKGDKRFSEKTKVQ